MNILQNIKPAAYVFKHTLKMEAEGFSERLVHRHVPEDWYVQRRHCLIAAGIVGCLTKWRWTYSVVLSRSDAETLGCVLFPFSEEQCLPSSIPSPTSQRRSLVAGVKSGVWLASCPLTSQTGGKCSAVSTLVTITDEEYWACGPVASQKPDYCAQSPLWGKADFAAWWSL